VSSAPAAARVLRDGGQRFWAWGTAFLGLTSLKSLFQPASPTGRGNASSPALMLGQPQQGRVAGAASRGRSTQGCLL